MQRLLDAGYPREDVYHYYSDLYVYVTPLTTRVIKEWLADMFTSAPKTKSSVRTLKLSEHIFDLLRELKAEQAK